MLKAWRRKILLLLAGVLAGGGGGFFCANNFSSASSPAPRTTANRPATPALTPDEIQNAVKTADARPTDIAMQRKLGLGLYQYAPLTPKTPYLADLARLLQRAHAAVTPDNEVTFALGQTLFALGRDGDAKQLAAARQCFAQLLKQNPKDSTTRAALGLAFLFDQPPQAARAVAELRQARQDSRQPASVLPGLIAALISLGQSAEAATSLQELARLDPNNLALPELRARLEALSGPPTPAVSH